MNLCAKKWNEAKFDHFVLAQEFKNSLSRGGLEIMNLGNTYMSDSAKNDGNVAESALDHIYCKSYCHYPS